MEIVEEVRGGAERVRGALLDAANDRDGAVEGQAGIARAAVIRALSASEGGTRIQLLD